MRVIYKIENVVTGKYYIGRSNNFHLRKNSHLSTLRNNKHGNKALQKAFNKHGENSFQFIIIKELKDDENLIEEEQKFLDELSKDYKSWNNCYNTSKSAKDGGNLCSDEQKEASSLRNIVSYRKEGNPNWKGGKTFFVCPECNREIRIASSAAPKVCGNCVDKNGDNNPFFGKHHSEETKRKLSEIRKGTYNGNQQKAVIIEGIEYVSVSEAARQFNVRPNTIINRINSKNKKFENYFYK